MIPEDYLSALPTESLVESPGNPEGKLCLSSTDPQLELSGAPSCQELSGAVGDLTGFLPDWNTWVVFA
jgi:hypothetical protein